MSIKKIKIYSNLLLGVLILLSFCVSAQIDSLQIEEVNGKSFYIHYVKKGNTLYSIHKKYNVPLEVLNDVNPGVKDGLSLGEKIYIPIPKNTTNDDGINGNYILHTIQKGQTLYSISKQYNVSQKDILAINPSLVNNFSVNKIIKIPTTQIKQESTDEQSNKESKYQTHLVKAHETLFSLSKLYKVSIDSIKLVNNGLTQGLKADEIIYIPIIKKKNAVNAILNPSINAVNNVSQLLFADSLIKKEQYTVALLLPFYVTENAKFQESKRALEKKEIFPKSKFAIDFYEGLKYGFSKLSNDSVQFKLLVYDTQGKDSARIHEILNKPELKEVDLIIGPLYSSNFKKAALFAKEHGINIVTPVKQSNKVLLGNPYVYKAIPSKTSHLSKLSEFLSDSLSKDLITAVYSKEKSKSFISTLTKFYNDKQLEATDSTLNTTIKSLKFSNSSSTYINTLSPSKNNVFVLFDLNEPNTTQLFSQLNSFINTKKNAEEYTITVICDESVLNYKGIDVNYFENLNLHVYADSYENTEDSLFNVFVKDFVVITKIYPNNQAVLGVEVATYFGGLLSEYGVNFSYYVPTYSPLSPTRSFKFVKTGVESGFENTNSIILRVKQFTLLHHY